MSQQLDLNLLPIIRQAGLDQPDIPGLSLSPRPARPARGRDADDLVIYFTLIEGPELPAQELQTLLMGVGSTYYETSGSVTYALKAAVGRLNQVLYAYNQTGAPQRAGLLSLLVYRQGQVYLAQSGPAQAVFVTAAGAQEFGDHNLPALGQMDSPAVHFSSASPQSNDTFLLVHKSGLTWSAEALGTFYGQGPESFRRRLTAQVSGDVEVVLLQARPGKGTLNQLRSATASLRQPGSLAGQDSPEPAPGGAELRRIQAEAGPPQALPHKPPTPTVQPPAIRSNAGRWRAGMRRAKLTVGTLLARILPDESAIQLPASAMAFMAVVIPVVIVAIGTVIYLQRGVALQSQITYNEALKAVEKAEQAEDPRAQREAWQTAMNYLEVAKAYPGSTGLSALHDRAQAAMDILNLVRRLDYQPVLAGGLPDEVRISVLLHQNEDLYLLDANSGQAFHAVKSGSGYQLNTGFRCGSNSTAGIGALIDIALWPLGKMPVAEIIGVDRSGQVIFCGSQNTPQTGRLQPPASRFYSGLVGMVQDQANLYLLDPLSNAVWIYWESKIDQEPQFFFSQQVPNMQNLVDLAVFQEKLFLLNADGYLTKCEFSDLIVSPTRCSEKVSFIDTRPGLENTALNPEQPYIQVFASSSPDPSLYSLEPQSKAISRFSLQYLVFQRKYLPVKPLEGGDASAFFVNPLEKLAFLATGNQVYYALLP